jgi:hypothetical protein
MHHKQEQQNGCNTVFPRDIVCPTNISINSLHTGDDDDDDDKNNEARNGIEKDAETILKYSTTLQ